MRRAILAAVAVIVICAAEARPQERPVAQGTPKSSPAETRQQQKKGATRERPPDNRAPILDQAKRDEADATARKADAQRKEDLEINSRLVLATEKTADYTGLLALVGAVQAIIFVWQLVMIRKSVGAAVRAADAASEGAKAAAESAKIARDSADLTRRQLRAYLTVDGGAIAVNPMNGRLTAQVKLLNSGQTPAYDVSQWLGLSLAAPDYPGPFASEPGGDTSPTIGPQSFIEPSISIDALNASQQKRFNTGELIFYIYGEAKYRDTFGGDHFTRFRLIMDKDAWAVGGRLVVAEDGNKSD